MTSRTTGGRASSFRTSFNQYLNDFATKVTLTRETRTLDSQNRVTSSQSTTSTIKADIQFVNKKDLLHLNVGEVEVGDGMLFVKYNADISLEDKVVFNDVTWRIINQIEGELVEGQVTYKGYIIRRDD